MTELVKYSREQPEPTREIGERGSQSRLSIRGHHITLFTDLVNHLAGTLVPLSLEEVSQSHAKETLAQIRADSKNDGQVYKKIFGYGDPDEPSPSTLLEDYAGGDEEEYLRKITQTNLAFLTLPDSTPTTIGTLIDPYCQNCSFGDNEGGFHCRKVWIRDPKAPVPNIDYWDDEDHVQNFARWIENFLTIPEIEEKRKENPEKYKWQINKVRVVKPMEIIYLPPGVNEERTEITLPLGLFRDMLAFYVAEDVELDREFNRQFYSFQEMVECVASRSQG